MKVILKYLKSITFRSIIISLLSLLIRTKMSVFFLKNKTVPRDPYHDSFLQENFNITFIPLLDHIHEDLTTITSYLTSDEFIQRTHAIIITSQRAVEALDAALAQVDSQTRDIVVNKLAYTVGPATEKILSALGFNNIKGGIHAGNGDVLSDIIIDTLPKDHKITFFTGETRRDIIPKKLTSNGYDLKELVIYKTIQKPGIIDRFTTSFEETGGHKWIVFFSPQGTTEIVSYLSGLELQNCKIASIGPTTEKYLIENGITPDLVSSRPDATSLLNDINAYR